MNLPNEKGERILYPRLVLSGQLDAEYIAGELADGTTFNAAEAMGMLTAFARKKVEAGDVAEVGLDPQDMCQGQSANLNTVQNEMMTHIRTTWGIIQNGKLHDSII